MSLNPVRIPIKNTKNPVPLSVGTSLSNQISPPLCLSMQRTITTKRVSFTYSTTIYYSDSGPPSQLRSSMIQFEVIPLNCTLDGGWLSDPNGMRHAPFCKLDYLCYGNPTEDDILRFDECDSLVGEVVVFNLDYHKEVRVHYTFDNWSTANFQSAKYHSSIGVLKLDKFKFFLPIPESAVFRGDELIIEVAIEYRVKTERFWDNFNGANYRFKCIKHVEDAEKMKEHRLIFNDQDENIAMRPVEVGVNYPLVKSHPGSPNSSLTKITGSWESTFSISKNMATPTTI